MNRYIALLRAINVGGYRKIKMDDLREMFESMDFENVQTYIQSGNVIFDSNVKNKKSLSQSIEKKIEQQFGHEVPVIIRTRDELKLLITQNPFYGENEEPFRLYLTFFLDTPSEEKQGELQKLNSSLEKFSFVNGDLFSLIDKKTDQKIRFSNSYIEKTIGVPCTSRNWRSVNKIFEMASH